MGTIIKRSSHQTGRTHPIPDKKVQAMPPGKRRSSAGKVYTENRRNRSDRSRTRHI